MASPTPRRPVQDPYSRYPPRPPRTEPPELVDPRFLLKAGALTLVAALLLAYLSVCLLYWQGGWQRLLFPTRVVDKTPASLNIPFQAVPFDSAATGSPRLSAWFLPSDSSTAATILYLHDGTGSLSSTLPSLSLLHAAGVAIFAIDYRGYGGSAGPHPNELRMQEDAAAALDYLVNTRHIPPGRIVPYGVGLGAVLAARLAAAHPELPAVILDQPKPDAYRDVVDDPHARLLPTRLLLREHFDLASALAGVRQPKLLLVNSPDTLSPANATASQAIFRSAPTPKTTVTFDHLPADDAYTATIRRFLDECIR